MYTNLAQFLTVHFQFKMPWSYLHCCQINEKCFRKNNNHKEIEILCCSLKTYTFSKLWGFRDLYTQLWFMLWLLWTGFDTDTLISLPKFISYLLTCVHNRNRFPFWTLVLPRNGRKQNFTNQDTELGTSCNGFAEL